MRPLLAVLVLLASPALACAQLKNRANADRINRRICGTVVDYTANSHGADRRFYSAILGMPRDLYVYLPPGYTPAKVYPFLLYFHLAYVDEHIFVGSNWIVQLDRMIERGEFPPVIVACPDGTISGQNRTREPHSMYINGYHGRYQDHITQELIPYLMRCYSIRPERGAHAVFGISAGAFGALNLALKHRDFFGSVATLAAPANLRYDNCNHNYRENFDPATYRWKERYDPYQTIGTFYFGLQRVPAKKYIQPVFGSPPGVEDRLASENPADLIFSTDLRPSELAIYLNYPGHDNWNFDAQVQSFAWLASQKGVAVTLECAPCGKHNLRYFRTNHEPAYRWLSQHLLPPVDIARPACASCR